MAKYQKFSPVDIHKVDIRIDPERIAFRKKFEKKLLGGVVRISFGAFAEAGSKSSALYSEWGRKSKYKTITARAVPYYAWCNRNKDKMMVWIPLK